MTKRTMPTVAISLGKHSKWMLTTVSLLLGSVVHAQATDSDDYFLYDMFAEGGDIGDARIQFVQQSNGTYIIAEQSHILTSGWWGKLDVRTDYVEEYSKQGQLLNADGKAYDGDTIFWSQVHEVDNEYWVSLSEVKTISKKEEDAFIGIAVGLASEYIPNVSEVLAIPQLLFSNDAQQSKSYRFAINDFDTSFNHLPFFWANNGQTLPDSIWLFNSEDLSITQYTVVRIADHFRLQPEQGKPIDIWLSSNIAGTPHFTKVIGEGEDGQFHMTLKPNKR